MAETKTKKTVTKSVKAEKKIVAKPATSTALKAVKSSSKTQKTAKEVVAPVAPVKEAKHAISVDVLDLTGKVSGKVSLPGEMFGAKANPTLIAQAVRVYLANQRVGTASSKTRGEVSGTTKKMYRQKGTGRARHGAAKAPIFVGGGITFGPKPRDFSLTMPTKMRRAALFSALSGKMQDKQVVVVNLTTVTGKTKEIVAALKSLKLENKKVTVVTGENGMVVRAARNIERVTVLPAQNLNTYAVMNCSVVVLSYDCVDLLKKTFLGGK